ncbi:MAG TPA: hypothetical protein H9867_02685 [Candidatus Corynebacterium gallistercoris]|uniref:Uncharacterized protein n=1 Tax=Candidatus Corynebacterium gallistercoris TaxID=2838530 RepID=A0A9D1UQV0_9CORY|nr:hypothetical protein [Candidatus Corynebacterium gallistercoris]
MLLAAFRHKLARDPQRRPIVRLLRTRNDKRREYPDHETEDVASQTHHTTLSEKRSINRLSACSLWRGGAVRHDDSEFIHWSEGSPADWPRACQIRTSFFFARMFDHINYF